MVCVCMLVNAGWIWKIDLCHCRNHACSIIIIIIIMYESSIRLRDLVSTNKLIKVCQQFTVYVVCSVYIGIVCVVHSIIAYM